MMTKPQRFGFIASAVTFMGLGLIFIIIGLKYDVTVLKYMGYFWFPAGLIQLSLLIFFVLKKKF